MAITVNNGGTSGRRRFHGTSVLSEINVTPFVDIVLVLLIIFMMTAHVMDSGIEVDVPKTKSVKESVKDLPIVKLTGDGEIYLNEKRVKYYPELYAHLSGYAKVIRSGKQDEKNLAEFKMSVDDWNSRHSLFFTQATSIYLDWNHGFFSFFKASTAPVFAGSKASDFS